MKASDSTNASNAKETIVCMLFVGVSVFVVKLIQGENLFNAARVLALHCALSFLVWIIYRSLKK